MSPSPLLGLGWVCWQPPRASTFNFCRNKKGGGPEFTSKVQGPSAAHLLEPTAGPHWLPFPPSPLPSRGGANPHLQQLGPTLSPGSPHHQKMGQCHAKPRPRPIQGFLLIFYGRPRSGRLTDCPLACLSHSVIIVFLVVDVVVVSQKPVTSPWSLMPDTSKRATSQESQFSEMPRLMGNDQLHRTVPIRPEFPALPPLWHTPLAAAVSALQLQLRQHGLLLQKSPQASQIDEQVFSPLSAPESPSEWR